MKRFRFWNAGFGRGEFHMAVDRVLLRRVEAGESEPMIRVYGWKPWCVTLGHMQDPSRELDFAKLVEREWTWCKRPTGGRAVLHAHELTYSLVASHASAPWCSRRDTSFEKIGLALNALLHDMGLSTALARGENTPGRAKNGPALPCFASTSRQEVTWQGHKLVGSAQRRSRLAFLQHGSMPLDSSFLRLIEAMPLDEKAELLFQRELQNHAVDLSRALGRPLAYDAVAGLAFDAFARQLEVEIHPAGLTAEELEEIDAEMQRNPWGSAEVSDDPAKARMA